MPKLCTARELSNILRVLTLVEYGMAYDKSRGRVTKTVCSAALIFLAEQLNQFFSRFEVETGTTIIPAPTIYSTSLESTINR